MEHISTNIAISSKEKSSYAKHILYQHGQTTQVMIGASPESDLKILRLSQGLYKNIL